MHWIIQDNLFREEGLVTLLEALERLEIPHDVVKAVPFSEEAPEDEQLIPNPKVSGRVMVCGSTMLCKIAKTRQWTPGSFLNENHDYRAWKENYGNHLLNPDAVVSRFEDVQPVFEEFFIRPCLDTKTFTGKVVTWEEYLVWKEKVLSIGEAYSTLDGDTMVSYAPIQTIYTETRFFIVDGKIATSSIYVCGGLKHPKCMNIPVDTAATDFVNEMIKIWQPARGFVMDVALTPSGYKIIEINCLNSSGFYNIDVMALIDAIENMEY